MNNMGIAQSIPVVTIDASWYSAIASIAMDANQTEIRRENYRPPEFFIDRVDLDVSIEEQETIVCSRLAVHRNQLAAGRAERIVLDGCSLDLRSVRLDGRLLAAAEYEVDSESLAIPVSADAFSIEIETVINPGQNTSLEGIYRSGDLICSQSEPEGFRKITYYLDRPDVMARFTTRITADRERYPVLLSNGNLEEKGELDGNRHWVLWSDPFPKPSYLFALVAGDLAHIEGSFTRMSGREVTIRVYVEPRNADKCAHALESIRRAMRWDEQTFGREYDLDVFMVVAVDDFNAGAMENKGLNIFNSKYVLARPETATDDDFENITSVIGHEYFHNWSGDRVTCRDWFQLSLKEGFTVFRDQLFTAAMTSPTVKRIRDVNILRTHQFREDAGPLAHPVRPESYVKIDNFYTLTVYNKGAEVVRMLHTILGADVFRRGCDLYFERHDGQAVTVENFVKAMEDVSARDLAQFRHWYAQAGTPLVEIGIRYLADERRLVVRAEQSCPPTPGQDHKEPYHVPLAVGLLDRRGQSLPLRLQGEQAPAAEETRLLELKQPVEEFVFEDIAEEPVLSALRGFSAPVKLKLARSDEELAFLMANDPDPFNRWDAAQLLATRLIGRIIDGQADTDFDLFIRAHRRNLEDSDRDRRLLALTLELPSEAYLAEQQEVIDPAAIHAARRKILRELALQLDNEFNSLYLANRDKGPYSADRESIGKRRLANTCLGYLAETDKPRAISICLDQFHSADNMTDVLAALVCLANHEGPERETLLAEFYEKWRTDPLVVDKWFIIQATSRLPGTFERVLGLVSHPAFDIKNPNKVRALIGAFCSSNPVRFHDPAGRGYEFLVDNVLTIDAFNPHIAARLLTPLSGWKKYEPGRAALMKAGLERIAAKSGISENVREMVGRSLEALAGGDA